MDRRFYKELWAIRFKKMLNLERKSVMDYGMLLKECKKIKKDHPIEPHLKKLIEDETKHARLVQEMIRILNRQPD